MEKYIKALDQFGRGDVEEVYSNCHFRLIEDRSSIIYTDGEVYLLMELDIVDDRSMVISALETRQIIATISVSNDEDNTLNVEAVADLGDLIEAVVQRYVSYLDAFVNYIVTDDAGNNQVEVTIEDEEETDGE